MTQRPAKKTSALAQCPICGEPTERAWRPFCSRRCADVDLGRWLKGAYAIPAGPPEADEDGDMEVAGPTEDGSARDGE